jgi:hypothetical protein
MWYLFTTDPDGKEHKLRYRSESLARFAFRVASLACDKGMLRFAVLRHLTPQGFRRSHCARTSSPSGFAPDGFLLSGARSYAEIYSLPSAGKVAGLAFGEESVNALPSSPSGVKKPCKTALSIAK